MELRKTEETLQAVANRQFHSLSCLSCDLDLYCIQDAKFVICPTCRCISPQTDNGHGVALGFTHATLQEMLKQ